MHFDLVAGNHKFILGISDVPAFELGSQSAWINFEHVLGLSCQPKQTTTPEILKRYESAFADRIGTLKGEAHLVLDHSVSPVILPSRNIAASLHPHVKKELNRMARLGV